MTRRTIGLLVTLALGLLVAPLAVDAQQPPARLARIAVLELTPALPPSAPTSVLAQVRPALRDLGWVEGQNLVIEARWAEGSLERFATLVAEVVRLPMEVIVVPNTVTARVAHQVTRTIPIVVASSSNPVRSGSSPASAGPVGRSRGSRPWAQSCTRNGWNCSRPPSPG